MYILSTYGLVSFATSVAEFINAGVLSSPFFGSSLVEAGFWNGSTQMAVANIVTGGLVWYFHWFRMAKDDFDSVLRQVYFYLLTVSGGAIAALVAATVTVQRLVTFAFGGVTVPLGSYFNFIGWAIPTVLIGTAIWGYHQRLAKEESSRITERRKSAERIHYYLMSFIGWGTMSTGIILLFGLILNLLTGITGQIIVAGTTWWQGQLGLCLALLIVGTPLWLYYWNGVLKRIEAGGIEEWRATSRRIFLYAVVVLSIGTLIADLVNIVYQILNGIVEEVVLDDVALVAQAQDEVALPIVRVGLHDVPENGASANFRHGFGAELGLFAKAGTQAAAQYHCFHRVYALQLY